MKVRHRKNLIARLREHVPAKHRCPECGKRGPHWIRGLGVLAPGFWSCPKFYGPDGRRIGR